MRTKLKVPKKQMMKWINALYSGEYKQTNGVLNDKYGFCCHGVNCKVNIPIKSLQLNEDKYIKGVMPNEQPKSPRWIKGIDNLFEIKTGRTLWSLNDLHEYTFPEIGTLLQLVYIEKALD